MEFATVTEPTGISAIAHTGRGVTLPAGRYEVVALDGVASELAYVKGPDGGKLVCIGRNDPGVTISEENA
jgi:hypothetical protein